MISMGSTKFRLLTSSVRMRILGSHVVLDTMAPFYERNRQSKPGAWRGL